MTIETSYPLTMQTIRDTLVARGEYTEEEIDAYLTDGGEDDEAQGAYERFIAPAVNAIEAAVRVQREMGA